MSSSGHPEERPVVQRDVVYQDDDSDLKEERRARLLLVLSFLTVDSATKRMVYMILRFVFRDDDIYDDCNVYNDNDVYYCWGGGGYLYMDVAVQCGNNN